MSKPRMFPIQTQRGAKAHPTRIPWHIAELAYSVYAANYGKSQSLEMLGKRGGFGPGEMDMFLPDWRERCEAERLRQSAWQPIETAPTDGTEILTFLRGHISQSKWRADCFGDWGWGNGSGLPRDQPTHWMPLPEPPSIEVSP